MKTLIIITGLAILCSLVSACQKNTTETDFRDTYSGDYTCMTTFITGGNILDR